MNAAMLLFGKQPQRFLISSEVKCAHFHGLEVAKPIPSYQVYKGTVFDLVDQAVDFVMSKINLWVGTREAGAAVPVAPTKFPARWWQRLSSMPWHTATTPVMAACR